LEGPICIIKPNFIKISQLVGEILHLMAFKMVASYHP